MSLRWLSYVVPKPPKGDSKTENGRFRCKIALRLNKVCYRVSLCENCQRQSYKAFIGLTVQKWLEGASPSTYNFWSKWQRRSEIADLRSLFAHSASPVTLSEKSSINTHTKSTTRFPMSLTMSPRWTSYVFPKPPQRVLKNAMCLKCEQYAAITPKRYEIGCQLLLIANRKSHTGFRLVPTSMTLNDSERRNSPYFAFFCTEFDSFAGRSYHSGWR